MASTQSVRSKEGRSVANRPSLVPSKPSIMRRCLRCPLSWNSNPWHLHARCVGSNVVKERHEPEIHVQLLVTMEECQPAIVRDELELEFLKSAQHDHIFDHSGCGLTGDTRQLKAVPV